ncbi:MAG: hypothetical protein HYW24_02540 [Candidatus Aenigmarchaeota archaeon]|nr:hypothetical protein [Candidatus Aenigmarchaeota archaeon]
MVDLDWTYPACGICLRNAHKKEDVVLRQVVSPNDETKFDILYVCTKCGTTRNL